MEKKIKTPSREQLKAEYRTYLSQQRGLAESTIYRNCSFLDRFLDFKFKDCVDDLSRITAVDITDFLYHLSVELQLRDKTIASTMRNFFRFLFISGKIKNNLAYGIPNVAQNYARRIPYHLTLDQVDELIKAISTTSTSQCKKRNYAMVLLMARLGLRPQEVIAIQLGDIDWYNGNISIHGKGGFIDNSPLLKDIGEAIADYIQHERQGSSRYLFLACRSPHKQFKDAQILNSVLRQALSKTSIPKPKKYTMTNMLRHSLATNLVQKGASLEEIGNTLRHRSRQTTLLYARQDIDGLRTIAQSWPLMKGGES